ncbi:MAG: anthranilate phosphoribosyltransferase [Deltaproteobacteria bacterium]|nr:MAG: anthranilate phosphoribosyltransferase [Deltaproteobacteria bacterium]
MEDSSLKAFGEVISLVMAGEHLARDTARKMFREILSDAQPELHQGAFLAALRMKGETEEEIAGCFEAIYETDTRKVDMDGSAVVENCGTGMDTLKTFNISTLAAIVAAGLGVPMARHGARAITSRCGTVDLCEALGVDVECPVDLVRRSIETCGIGLFNGMSPEIHPGGLGRILSRIRFGSTLNIAASLANPALPKIGVRGVGAPGQVAPTLEVMRRIGYRRALVFHGFDETGQKGMDELSSLGVSRMGILGEDGKTEFREVRPRDVGIPQGTYGMIRPADTIRQEAAAAVRLLAGEGPGPRTDIVALNAAAVLWVGGSAPSLDRGVGMARDYILSGKGLGKLARWVEVQNRRPLEMRERLNRVCREAGVEIPAPA